MTYIEPFLGGGAAFLHLVKRFNISPCYLIDINPDLILTYTSVQQRPDALISKLQVLETRYKALSVTQREDMYYKIRGEFNQQRAVVSYQSLTDSAIQHAAHFIFLNRTCYNGLYRVNQKGAFNVPSGKYINPTIANTELINDCSQALQEAEIICGDFGLVKDYVSNPCFVYYDPPYQPISKTSSFTAYNSTVFDNSEQCRLADVYKILHHVQVQQMLSNSDPENFENNDQLLNRLYGAFSINKVDSTRSINSNPKGRGRLSELLITNYPSD